MANRLKFITILLFLSFTATAVEEGPAPGPSYYRIFGIGAAVVGLLHFANHVSSQPFGGPNAVSMLVSVFNTTIMGCPSTRQLLSDVKALYGHNLRVTIHPYEEIKAPAVWNYEDGSIRILQGRAYGEMLGSVIAGLAGLSQKKKLDELDLKMCSINKHQYADLAEAIGFNGTKVYDEAIRGCEFAVSLPFGYSWSYSLKEYNFKNFRTYLCQAESTHHTAGIRIRHEVKCGKRESSFMEDIAGILRCMGSSETEATVDIDGRKEILQSDEDYKPL